MRLKNEPKGRYLFYGVLDEKLQFNLQFSVDKSATCPVKLKAKEWFLLDLGNGNPELGFGYVWVFPTKLKATLHLALQNANHPKFARLDGPWKVSEALTVLFKRATIFQGYPIPNDKPRRRR